MESPDESREDEIRIKRSKVGKRKETRRKRSMLHVMVLLPLFNVRKCVRRRTERMN